MIQASANGLQLLPVGARRNGKRQQFAWNGSKVIAINEDLLDEGYTAAGAQPSVCSQTSHQHGSAKIGTKQQGCKLLSSCSKVSSHATGMEVRGYLLDYSVFFQPHKRFWAKLRCKYMSHDKVFMQQQPQLVVCLSDVLCHLWNHCVRRSLSRLCLSTS